MFTLILWSSTFNTTLRSIIPLPDPKSSPNLSSHPSNLEDFPRGSTVLGLYPDTTSFYRATVVSAPIPGTGMGLGVKNGNGRLDPGAKKGMYRLAFVDDGDNVHEVNKDYVIIVSIIFHRWYFEPISVDLVLIVIVSTLSWLVQ